MKCADSCRLFGAYQAVSGIDGNVVLLHSVEGCNFGTMSLHLAGNMQNMRQAGTIMGDQDIIFGGEETLRESVDRVLKLYHPDVITVITGCAPEIIGDDVRTVTSQYDSILPVVYINGAGFKGHFETGYEDALITIAKRLTVDSKKTSIPVINILGMNYDDFKIDADIKEFKRILGNKVKLNCVTARCNLEEFMHMSRAGLNIVFSRGRKLAEFLKNAYGTEFIEMDYPYGITGSCHFLDSVGKFFVIDFSEEKERLKRELEERLKKCYSYLKAFYGLPVSVFGESGRASGMRRFLEEELGMDVVSLGISSDEFNMDDFITQACKSDAALIFGSSFEADIADQMEIPLIRYLYPVFDWISISDSPYIGGKGVIYIIEDILHTVINCRKNKGGLYFEKNMCLR